MRCGAALILLVACGSGSSPGTPVVATRPALTRISDAAKPIVDAWATAMGGRDRLGALAATHIRGSITKGGITGTIDIWQTAHGERREAIELGFLRELRVFDGTRGWLVDRNRAVRRLAGFELDDQLALAYLGADAAALPDRRAGEVTIGAAGLTLAPAGGHRPVTIVFDPATHLPATYVRRDREKQRTTRLADWRAIDGVQVPFELREDSGDPNDVVAIRVTSVEHARPLAGAFVRPPDREPDMTGTATVPFELAFGGLVFVPVIINGAAMTFVLDTGAESTVLNASRLGTLGLTATGAFAAGAGGGDVVVSYVPHVTTQVGDAKVSDQIVAAIPLDSLEPALGRKLDGILGYDFLARFVVELDYARKTMTLHDRASYHHPPTTPVAITLEDSTPFIDATIDLPGLAPLIGHFVLDTGCLCEIQLSAPFTDQHGLLAAVPEAKQAGFSAGAGGVTHEVTGTITSLRIGSTVIDKPRADFSRDSSGATADPESAGLIGSAVWRRFVLVLDYAREQVWLDPPR